MAATIAAHPFPVRVVRPRDRTMILVVVEYASGGRAYVRIAREKASLGASLSAAIHQCQASGEIPAGVVTRITRAH